MQYQSEYIPPTLTCDSVILQFIEGDLSVLVIKRKKDPFKDLFALPGGYVAQGFTTLDGLVEITKRKAGVDMKADLGYIEQLYTFDTVARDPRGHAVSVSYLGLGRNISIKVAESVEEAEFISVHELPQLAFDHNNVIHMAIERLQAKMSYTNAVFALLPDSFTLTELQKAYENIYDRELDKRNFRKKFLSLGLIQETGEMSSGNAHRPAKLYKFNKPELETLTRSFD